MKRKEKQQQGKNAFDLIEEATQLLRTASAGALAFYFTGSIPFVLGLLFFWADMSRSPLAPQHLADASLGMAALFCWMKFWHVLFARRIRAQAAGRDFSWPSLRCCWRIFVTQSILQPTGLFVLPLASIPVLPFGWAYAFYQSATALDDGLETGTAAMIKKSWRQAALWPRQNNTALAILSAFTLAVFLNWSVVCLVLPELCKMLLGIESNFTKSPFSLLNSTFFAALCGLTYLCVDPILKTLYALRCFYGQSLQSGEDLKSELKTAAGVALKTAAAIALLASIFFATPTRAQSTNAPAATSRNLAPADLDRVINQTIHENKYVWRMPREEVIEPESKEGLLERFFDRVGTMLRNWLHAVGDWLDKLEKWLRKLFPSHETHEGQTSNGYGWIMMLQIFLWILVAAVVIALGFLLYRIFMNRRAAPIAVASQAIQPAPDVGDENVRADQLPEDSWIRLARELLEKGEFRLAMRAFYLAGLAHLAGRSLITIARFKSNRDYERELRRRAHALPELTAIFGDNVSTFERIWYGRHAADREQTLQFAAGMEKIRNGA